MSAPAEPAGTVEMALTHAARLLESQPAAAVEQANEILRVVPDHPIAQLILGAARRALGDIDGALAILEPLAKAQPLAAAAHYELGIALGAKGQGDRAIAALRRAVTLKPDMPAAWRALGDHLTAIGDTTGADEAYARSIKYSTRDPRLMEAATHLCDGRLAPAEALLREHLKIYPTDVAAIRMLAEVAARLGRYGDAEILLARCLELAPSFHAARHNYAVVLHRQHKVAAALAEIDAALAAEPRNPGYRNLKAAILSRIGDQEQAITIYAAVLSEYPHQPKVWMSYGHALKTAGRRRESIEAYRAAIDRAPHLGEAYWSLANLKTFRFSPDDIERMQAQLARADLAHEDRLHFEFALGKALEDTGAYAESFQHYERGNALRRATTDYDPDETSRHVQRSKALFTREFFAARSGWGCPAPDPIFIVGLPRAGSTLIEQILSSHSEVEGTMELPDLIAMARGLGGRKTRREVTRYPEVLAELEMKDFYAMGEQFLAATGIQRRIGAPFFIDKMPNNFAHIGLIHLILPNAKIIDARRHPLGCCFSGFKQHFARGQNYTYNLRELGRYYRDYVELLAHFDAVLPGRIHRIYYEDMVGDTEAEVRRLLAYCHLRFEVGCLRFYENQRAVRTASSEQVRRPIYREGLDQWRHYEPWLGPLKEALGPVLASYPAVPCF
ncbi:MAG TPA: sulfotransferase [Steroidobacteraceae bacterium]|nr:sulfotransferase [Steroidobacteraceae bacterium]